MNSITPTVRILFLFIVLVFFSLPVTAEQKETPNGTTSPTLKKAVMCESVQDGLPVDQTIVFDVSKGSAYCWSDFDPVSEDGIIYTSGIGMVN